MGHRDSATLYLRRGTTAIRLPSATSIVNAELHAICLPWMSSEDLKENTSLAVRFIFQYDCTGMKSR